MAGTFWDQIVAWWNKPPEPRRPAQGQRQYYGNSELKAAPVERIAGPTNQTSPQQGSAKFVRQTEYKPTDTPARNEFERTNALRKRDDLRETAWVANPNYGKDSGGVVDNRDAVTLDDYLGMQDERLKTRLSYDGDKITTVKGKDYKKLGLGQQLAAQHNTLLDELAKLDADMYSELDTGGTKDADGKEISDDRVTWGEAGEKTKQKGARAAFEAVHGRAPTADDTFTPNIDAYLNLAGVKGLDLYTAKGAQDMVNDLYIASDEVDRIQADMDKPDRELHDDRRDRIDVARDLYKGISGIQDVFTGSKGVNVNVGDDRATSELDLTRFDHDQRVNLAMIIGTSIAEEDPETLFRLDAIGKEQLSKYAVTPNTHEEPSRYAAPGMGGLNMDLLADPKVRQELESNRASLDAVMNDATANGVKPEEVFDLLAGKDVDGVKASEFLDYINSDVLPKVGKLNASQLQDWIKEQNERDAMAKTTGPDGLQRRSVGGDESLRELLYGGKATLDSAVQEAAPDSGQGPAPAAAAKPELEQRVAYLRDQARFSGQELIDMLVAEGYDEAAARAAAMGG